MAEEQPRIEEATIEIAGQKINLKGMAVNTVLTVAVALGVVFIGTILMQHVSQAATREENFAKALFEMVQAQREQNCLIAIPEAQREAKADFCKRVTR